MTRVFDPAYAGAYDLLYQDKDYVAECDMIEQAFRAYGSSVRSVLDLGCGTGTHALELSGRGYTVAGVDRSENMLSHARAKAKEASSAQQVSFHQGDVRSIDLQRTFDAAVMMFAVLGYQYDNQDVLSTLKAVRRHLEPGGLFVFDVWYGPAVLNQRPSEKVKIIPTPGGQIIRRSSGDLDSRRHIVTVHFHVWQLEQERLVSETQESHPVRFFFPLELEFYLASAGLDSIRIGVFPDFTRDPDETTWNILGIARAV